MGGSTATGGLSPRIRGHVAAAFAYRPGHVGGLRPPRPLTAAQRAELDEQVERLAYVWEGTAELTIGRDGVGPHV
ncbi:hypothetical protein [Streptomyces auratus]|uniref:Uncharacterized protein n=1 Tax=Streptomyces auratus AGR0001 TaxID=1160718 RepID=J2K8X3_9ACTN|nr:hypothetical protein [Streptomyces auratus]QTZ95242.1 hypothetical protein SU9_030445 [Streptomyces auratus AGR0001]